MHEGSRGSLEVHETKRQKQEEGREEIGWKKKREEDMTQRIQNKNERKGEDVMGSDQREERRRDKDLCRHIQDRDERHWGWKDTKKEMRPEQNKNKGTNRIQSIRISRRSKKSRE